MCSSSKITNNNNEPWPQVVVPSPILHIIFTNSLHGSYFLVIVDGFSDQPEICDRKTPTSSTITNLLHELFAKFSAPEAIVPDDGTQLVSFKHKISVKLSLHNK